MRSGAGQGAADADKGLLMQLGNLRGRRLIVTGAVALLALGAATFTVLTSGSSTPPAPPSQLALGSPGAPAPTPASSSTPRSTASPAAPVPVGFVGTDLSFVSATTGWALGTAPCTAPTCTSLLATSDGGKTWTGRPAPVAALVGEPACTDQRSCISSLRFADSQHGYAFGGALITTNDGGATWTRQDSPFVDALEATGTTVLRVVHTSDGCPPGCTYTVQRAAVGSATWTTLNTPALEGNRALLFRQGKAAYVMALKNPAGGAGDAHAGLLVSRDDGITWAQQTDPCGLSAPNAPDEQDATAAAVAPDGSLAVLCAGRSSQRSSVVVSTDQARTFGPAATLPVEALGVSLSAASRSRFVVSATSGPSYELLLTTNTGATWTRVAHTPNIAGVTNRFLGFTTARVATAAQPDRRRLWRSLDGGTTWSSQPWR